jgi:hypothetical protein
MAGITLDIIREDITKCSNLSEYYGVIDLLRKYCAKCGNSDVTKELYLQAHDKSNEIINAL